MKNILGAEYNLKKNQCQENIDWNPHLKNHYFYNILIWLYNKN